MDILGSLFCMEKKGEGKYSLANVSSADINQSSDGHFRELNLATFAEVLQKVRQKDSFHITFI